jgi:hypothetical protein
MRTWVIYRNSKSRNVHHMRSVSSAKTLVDCQSVCVGTYGRSCVGVDYYNSALHGSRCFLLMNARGVGRWWQFYSAAATETNHSLLMPASDSNHYQLTDACSGVLSYIRWPVLSIPSAVRDAECLKLRNNSIICFCLLLN